MQKNLTAFVLTLLLGLSNDIFCQITQEILTNKEVIELSKAELGDDLIASKISSSKCNFDLTTSALIELRKSGVSKAVIEKMMSKSTSIPTDNLKNTNANTDDATTNLMKNFYESGFYFQQQNGYSKLDHTILTDTKNGTSFGGKMVKNLVSISTLGIIGGGNFIRDKWTANIDGGHANFSISDRNPVFYFYFDKETPNDYTLLKLESNSENRKIVLGSRNKNNVKYGMEGDQTFDFVYQRISPVLYVIKTREPLLYGQYCFVRKDASNLLVQQKEIAIKMYDFEVQRNSTPILLVNTIPTNNDSRTESVVAKKDEISPNVSSTNKIELNELDSNEISKYGEAYQGNTKTKSGFNVGETVVFMEKTSFLGTLQSKRTGKILAFHKLKDIALIRTTDEVVENLQIMISAIKK